VCRNGFDYRRLPEIRAHRQRQQRF
jgi:hypothetical protein